MLLTFRALYFLAVILVGTVLRANAAQSELWFDELWSVSRALNANSLLEMLFIRHDNNHLLNSAWLWIALHFNMTSPLAFRAEALFFGVASILCVVLYAAKGTQCRDRLFFTLLFVTSYLMTLYGSEARGYSASIFCTIVGLTILLNVNQDNGARDLSFYERVSFVAAAIFGLLSHATHLFFLVPALIWLLIQFGQSNGISRKTFYGITVPIFFVGTALFWFFYRGMEIGGAPRLPYVQVLSNVLSISFGGAPISKFTPEASGWSLFGMPAVLGVCLFEIAFQYRENKDRSILIILLLVTPLVTLTILQPVFILGRYFLVPILVLYFVLASFLARMSKQSVVGAATSISILLLYALGNVKHVSSLTQDGRASYLKMYEEIASSSKDPVITVGTNQVFQNQLRFETLVKLGKFSKNIQFISDPSDFFIWESLDQAEPVPSFSIESNYNYTTVRDFHSPPESGSRMALLRRMQQ